MCVCRVLCDMTTVYHHTGRIPDLPEASHLQAKVPQVSSCAMGFELVHAPASECTYSAGAF